MKDLKPSEIADHKYYLEGKEGKLLRRSVCTPGTRVHLLDDIIRWVKNTSADGPSVYWLFGHAGSGKSTIAYTVARRFEYAGEIDGSVILGGNFFCSRQFEETKQSKCIIRTIAYHLALVCKPFADVLRSNAVYRNPKAQLEGLLVKPWRESKEAREAVPKASPHYLIIIDALDEIDGEGGLELLSELFEVVRDGGLAGLKFFATSRPDPDLVNRVDQFERKELYRLQDVGKEEAEKDIKMYLAAELPHLADSPEMGKLVASSDGLFIYAATIVRYLAGYGPTEQEELLDELLSGLDAVMPKKSLSLLDTLYQQILSHSFLHLNEVIRIRRLRILHTFLCTAERTSQHVVAGLFCPPDRYGLWIDGAAAILKDLHAVLYIEDNRIMSYHKSFSDFMFDRARCQEFWCDRAAHHRLLTESCFRVMRAQLKFNIANIPSSFILDRDNTTLQADVEHNVSAVLRYSCRYWSHHLCATRRVLSDPVWDTLSQFLHLHALFWVEVMNLLKVADQCDTMIRAASEWVGQVGSFNGESFAPNLEEVGPFFSSQSCRSFKVCGLL